MNGRTVRIWLTGWWLCLCVPWQAGAQTAPSPVVADLAATTPPVRIGEPMPTLWDVQKFQPGILEGVFRFRVHLGTAEFYHYTTDEVVLHEAQHQFVFLFPPVVTNLNSPELEIDVTWLPKRGAALPLRMQILRVPFSASKTVLMGVAEPRTFRGRRPDWQLRLDGLRLEMLGESVEPVNDQLSGRLAPLQTVLVTWTANQVPADPLMYLAYEVVVVGSEVLSELRRPQLEALAAWCRSGGGLYVEAGGLPEQATLDFLNTLTTCTAERWRWSVDNAGELVWPAHGPTIQSRCDWGRVVIVDASRAKEIDLQQSARYLWDWPSDLNPNEYVRSQTMQRMYQTAATHRQVPLKTSLQQQLERDLMPSSVQLVPWWLIIALLGGLLILIGPLDWFWLGALRWRRFTWISWPAWTMSITLLMLGLSNWYLAASDTSQKLVIRDYGHDGSLLRTHEFSLAFPSRSRQETGEIARGLWQPLPGSAEGRRWNANYPTGTSAAFSVNINDQTLASVPSYSGRVPSRYTTSLAVSQWVPQSSYCLSFPTAEERDTTPIDWAAVDRLGWQTADELPDDVLSELQRQLGPNVSVSLMMPLDQRKRALLRYATLSRGHWINKTAGLVPPLSERSESAGILAISEEWRGTPFRYVVANCQNAIGLIVGVEDEHQITWHRRMVPIARSSQ